ncbi:MAG TPA: hypothetical protein VGO40_06985 [Longimicrobium sp.]|jgi:hypothetical protein|nr:hypothetical protein [Longimicrobium sp.]
MSAGRRYALPAPSGRWVREGNRILLLPAGGAAAARGLEGELETPGGGPATPGYTVCDFIHPRIDVAAQYALFGLLRRGRAARAAALAMLAAVRAGDSDPGARGVLRGIFQEDQREPALRARSSGGWWKLIPEGRDAVCVPGPPPLVAFRRSLAKSPALLGTELLRVWPRCGLPVLPAPPPSGRSCTRPAPKTGTGLTLLPPEIALDTGNMVAGRVLGSFRIQSASGSVPWRVRNAPAWMVFTPSAGTATPAGAQVSVTVDPASLPKGRNGRNLWIDSAGARSVDLWVDVFVR